MKTLIFGSTIVDGERVYKGSIVTDDDKIEKIYENETPREHFDKTIDASGCFVIPGVIDEHVHFREPGMTEKADICSESRAAAAGGVTSFFDMPNTTPPTTSLDNLEDKFRRASQESRINYSFFFGATNSNYSLFNKLDVHRIPGVKLFMGASTGNMLVDKEEALQNIFKNSPLPIMTHCEDTAMINRNMAEAKQQYGEDPDIRMHYKIRSEEACIRSTELAISLAKKYDAQLHVAHITTARELDMIKAAGSKITGEAVIAHLMFDNSSYEDLGALIKCNPSVKTSSDRDSLRKALTDGRIYTVATDHAPHLLSQKQGGCAKAVSGMPMVQFSLCTMLTLASQGVLPIERVVELMCNNPARLFSVRERGFLREGYKADIAIVKQCEPYTVTNDMVISKCGWTPLTNTKLTWKVVHTLCNGRHVYNNGIIDDSIRGEEIRFR